MPVNPKGELSRVAAIVFRSAQRSGLKEFKGLERDFSRQVSRIHNTVAKDHGGSRVPSVVGKYIAKEGDSVLAALGAAPRRPQRRKSPGKPEEKPHGGPELGTAPKRSGSGGLKRDPHVLPAHAGGQSLDLHLSNLESPHAEKDDTPHKSSEQAAAAEKKLSLGLDIPKHPLLDAMSKSYLKAQTVARETVITPLTDEHQAAPWQKEEPKEEPLVSPQPESALPDLFAAASEEPSVPDLFSSKPEAADAIPSVVPLTAPGEKATYKARPKRQLAEAQAIPEVRHIAPAPPTQEEVTITAEDWEQQRERELLAAKRAEMEEIERQELATRREQNQKAEKEWVDKRARSDPVPLNIPDDPQAAALYNLTVRSTNWQAALQTFEDFIKMKLPGDIELYRHAHHLSLSGAPQHVREGLIRAVFGEVRKHGFRNRDVLSLRLASRSAEPNEYVEEFLNAQAADRARLSRRWKLKALACAKTVGWEQALKVYSLVSDVSNSRNDMECLLLNALARGDDNSRQHRRDMVTIIENKLTRGGRAMLPIQAESLATAHWFTGRGQLAKAIIESCIANKTGTYRMLALPVSTEASSRQEYLEQLEANGYDLQHPNIVLRLMTAQIREDDITAALASWKVFTQSPYFQGTELNRVFRFQFASVLLGMASREGLDAILNDLYPADTGYSIPVILLERLFVVLSRFELYDKIIEIFRRSATHSLNAPVLNAVLPTVHAAQRALGQEPNATVAASSGDRGDLISATSTSSEPAMPSMISHSRAPEVSQEVMNRMLQLAKDRLWEDALAALPTAEEPSIFMLNCCISAAVEQPDVVEGIMDMIGERKLVPNSTTYNTAMTAFARPASGRWEKALELFDTVPTASRDFSSYSVALNVASKRELWQTACGIYNEVKSRKMKMTQITYGLMIGATHRQSWESALSILKDMSKTKGIEVKDVMYARVIGALEAAGKSDLVTGVNELKLKGKTGKKKEKRKAK